MKRTHWSIKFTPSGARLTQEAADKINRAKSKGGRVVAVGTTSVRTLESAVKNGALKAFEGPTKLVHPAWL